MIAHKHASFEQMLLNSIQLARVYEKSMLVNKHATKSLAGLFFVLFSTRCKTRGRKRGGSKTSLSVYSMRTCYLICLRGYV